MHTGKQLRGDKLCASLSLAFLPVLLGGHNLSLSHKCAHRFKACATLNHDNQDRRRQRLPAHNLQRFSPPVERARATIKLPAVRYGRGG